MKQHYLLLAVLCLLTSPAFAQVRINEAVSSNSTYTDEDGDSPDWFELHNTGPAAVDLAGYSLSDKADNPGKWTIPGLTLAPGGYAFFWASGKDRTETGTFRTFIQRGDVFRYLVPTSAVNANWTDPDFDAANWPEGPSGFGYGDGDDATQVPAGTLSVFVRKKFTVNSLRGLEALILDIDYDDGFVAYLNGVEIARENMSVANPRWDDRADGFTEPRLIGEAPPLRFNIDDAAELLVEGENVLAIQVHNSSPGSSDLSLIPFLSARFAGGSAEGGPPPEILAFTDQDMHTNFRISSSGETLFLHDGGGAFVDSLPVYDLPANVSVGIPGNGGEAVLFGETTPGARNPDTGFQGVVDERVIFSAPGGQTQSFALELSGVSAPNTIRYTIDGSEPTISSLSYFGPIPISRNRVVRAAAFRPGYLPSPISSETYLIGTNHTLPVVSLVTEPDNFFSEEDGIYTFGDDAENDFPHFGANFWEDREVPVHFSIYGAAGEADYGFDAGTKIFGGWSRGQDQRSLSIFARGRYGTREMEYPFFPQREYDTFQALVLRNSGNDLYDTGMRDVIMTGLMENSAVDIQAYRSVAAYINGEYWGMYNLREKVNEHFLASLHDVEPDSIDLLEFNAAIVQGSNAEYLALMDYAENNPVDEDEHYAYLAERIDIDNYIQYQLAQIYYDNRDWPGNNIKYWKSPTTKWRWILYDTDFGAAKWNANAAQANTLNYALETNGPNWPNPPWSTLLLRRLMSNETFRHRFINQMADEMNSRFLPQEVINRINSHANLIAGEIPRHDEVWGRQNNWSNNVERMRSFFRARPENMKRFIRNRFSLPAHHRLGIRITDPAEGFVRVNSLTIEQTIWRGDYFENVPINVTAVPNEGYVFQHWEIDRDTENAELSINMTGPVVLRPVFVEESVSVAEPGNSLRSVAGLAVSPNPSAGELRLRFTARRATRLTATLYGADGRKVRDLTEADFGAGPQVQSWDMSTLPAGAYWLDLREAEGGRAVVKWVRR